MGAWSHEAFGNDTACDWACGLDEVDDLSLVESAIAAVVDAPAGDLEAPEACEALAAAEVVARLRGHAGDSHEATDDWVARTRLSPPDALVRRALAAVERIGGNGSELKGLWDESDSAEAWHASLADLHRRLLAPPQPLPAPLDDIAKVVRRVGNLSFAVPEFPADDVAQGPFPATARPQLFFTILAAEAQGDSATVREGIARIWHRVDLQAEVKILWDLAVREAKTWAAEGQLALALAGLEPWRETAEALGAGTFDMRAMAVCQEAGDYALAEQARERLIAAGVGATMQLLDKALLEARAGSADAALALLNTHQQAFSIDAFKPWIAFALGILAARERRPEALTLLTPWVDEQVVPCVQGAAVWGFFGIGAGWWALALHQAGRTDEARAVVAAIRPVMLTPENALLADELQAAGLLDTAAPVRPRAPSPETERAGVETDHGAFKTVSVRGVNALRQVEAYRRAFAGGSRLYPFLIGDADDLEMFLEGVEPPADGGQATLEASRQLDVTAWLKSHGAAKPPRWQGGDAQPTTQLQSLFEIPSRRLKPLMFIGLVEVGEPEALFARLGWGHWNDGPAPAEHVALHRHWREQHGAGPVVVSHDVVECLVARPAADRKAALALAVEQQAYCLDIVEHGVGSTAALAATLLGAPVWYFWWD